MVLPRRQGGCRRSPADLVAALKHCQTAIRADAKALLTHRDAGTTITLAYVVWPDLYVVHVGDSRCYLLRDGQLEQLTTDHAVAHHGGDGRLIDPQAAEPSRWNHMLWNVLNAREEESKSDGCRVELKLGDTLLLCTDGLTKHLAADEVVRLLSRDQGARDACRTLVDAAMHRGGRDNITVVVAQFQDVDTKLDKPNRAERLLSRSSIEARARGRIEIDVVVKQPCRALFAAGLDESRGARTSALRPARPAIPGSP